MKRTPLSLWLVLALMAFAVPGAHAGSVAAAPEAPASLTASYLQTQGQGPAFYGVEYGWVDQDRDLYLQRYRLLNPNLVRVQITQQIFEPVNDNADPNASAIDFNRTIPLDLQQGKTLTFRDLFTTLGAQFPQMHFQINLWLPARWNAASQDGYLGLGGAFPPVSEAEHAEFVRELARWLVNTCGIAPQRLSFSFVNEPNLSSFFVGTGADLVRMASVTRAALNQVSPDIQMAGLDEVHGVSMTDAFYPVRPAGCCDLWTFHAYEKGIGPLWDALNSRIQHLSAYGPVWVTEFADTNNGSPDAQMDFSTRDAALGFAELAGRLWASDVQGIVHFRLSDTFSQGGPVNAWAGHGLFADWRGVKTGGVPYAFYPAFWVFTNLYNQLGGAERVTASASSGLVTVAARRAGSAPSLAIWVTNPSDTAYSLAVEVRDFPYNSARVLVLDNLAGIAPVANLTVQGSPLRFTVPLARRSSYTLRVLVPGQTCPQLCTPGPSPTQGAASTPLPAPDCPPAPGCVFIPLLMNVSARGPS